MTPTYEEMLQGATRWGFKHKGINCELSHHGYRGNGTSNGSWDYDNHPGTWCYYLYANELQYPESWPDFRVTFEDGYGQHGRAWDYVDFYGGITWASDEPFYDRKLGRMIEQVKVGCDYNHLWDAESGHCHSMGMVKSDAIKSAEDLLRNYPTERVRCAWSGAWVKEEDSYVAINGATVSRDAELPEEYKLWKEPK